MKIRTIRSLQDLETIRTCWEKWQNHPNNDIDHFQLICRLRSEVLCPYVAVVEHNGKPCALLAARMERTHFVPYIGYFKPIRIPATVLMVIHEGVLGELDEEIGKGLVQHVQALLSRREAEVAVFSHLPESSPLLQALLADRGRWWKSGKTIWPT